jgi:hypothetical protein
MHLLEIYALTTGSKIKKPFIVKKYFPLPFDKYITIQNSSGMPAKCYSYFQEIINFLKPSLDKKGIKIVQIGSKEDIGLLGVVNLQGQSNINQTAYILSNSLLHVGNDSFAIHMASSFGIPLIGLYSVSSPDIAGPYWKNDNQICLIPEGDWKPSFNPNESPKKIDSIKIETIIKSIEKLLFNDSEIKIKTKYIGEKFTHRLLEALPDQVLPQETFPNELLNIRFDYKSNFTDLNALAQNLNFRPCSIITKQPLNIEALQPLFKNLKLVIYDVTEDIDVSFIEKLHNLGIQTSVIFKTDIGNEDDLNNRKLAIIELPINIQEVSVYPKNLPSDIEPENIFRTNKILFGNNKIYASKAAFLENKDTTLKSDTIVCEQKIKDISNFDILKEDLDYGYVYENIS